MAANNVATMPKHNRLARASNTLAPADRIEMLGMDVATKLVVANLFHYTHGGSAVVNGEMGDLPNPAQLA